MTESQRTHANRSNTNHSSAATQLGVTSGTLLVRRIVASICVSSLMFQMGCYTTIPITSNTETPTGIVTITVNDKGRTELGPRFGGLLDHMTAHITSADANQIKVTVAEATDVKDHKVNWADEPATISRESIISIERKQLNKRKSWLLAGIVAVAGSLFFLVVGKNAGNIPDDPGTGITPI